MDEHRKYGLIRRFDAKDTTRHKSGITDDTIRQVMDIDGSITMGSDEIRRFLDSSSVIATPTQSRTLFALNDDENDREIVTAKQKTDLLYCNFLEILQSRTNDSEVFDTVKDLIQTCSDTITEVQRPYLRSKFEAEHTKDFEWLTRERDTWRLLYALYKDRLIVQKEQSDFDDLPLVGSEKDIVEHLYANNANLREYQLIVDWLEQSASEQGVSQIGHYSDRTVGWENTLLQLKNVNQSIFGNGKDIVKSMDPDAPNREHSRLHDLDMDDQKRLSRQILNEIRKGKIEDAQSLCEHCGQPWQAAVLEGWRLHHDPNFELNDPSSKTSIEGNPRRDLWKKLAWMAAEKRTLDEYTRAIVGVLCGHLESALKPLSNSWADLLWAYLKIQIDIRVESEVRSCSIKSYLEMPDKYWNGKMSLEQIFDELGAHENITVHMTAQSPVNVIQKYLILDSIPEMMKCIDAWISETQMDGQMLRFLAHIVLFMRQVGRHHQEDIADRVIKAYVECLIAMGETQLVAFYTAAVPQELQTLLYSKFLQTVSETTSRRAALEEAITVGLDVYAITAYAVDQIRCQQPGDDDDDDDQPKQLEGTTNALDARKISSLEWLTFYPNQKGELLWQTNAMIRTFLAENKIECVRETFKVIPHDAISQLISNYGSKDNLVYRDECSIKEYLCYQTYLGAIDGYNDWTRLYHSKPKEPQLVGANANFTERIASEHREHAYKADLERWKVSLKEQTRVSRELLYNVLLFPDKGFLIDPEMDKPIDEEMSIWQHRLIQLDSLRKLCIPEVVLLLQNILHLAGCYKDCVRLADELASEKRQLYTVYTKHKLAEIIAKISESSLALMNEKLDPWGYTIGT